MARKPKHEEHENHERWLVSYADFITLLFAFFVVMYAVSSVNEGKYRVLSDSVVAAFQSPQKSLKPIQVGNVARSPQSANLEFKETSNPIAVPESPMKMPTRGSKHEGNIQAEEEDFSEFPMSEERATQDGMGINDGQPASEASGEAAGDQGQGASMSQLSSIANEVEVTMQPLIDRDLISVKRFRRWIEVEINTNILFASGSAQIAEQSIPVLEALARVLSAFPNKMRVEGFTDNQPIKSQLFPSNWELSAARSASVVRLFAKEGIEPGRMAAIGYGEFQPVAHNDTPEGRIKNRRVVVVVMANRYLNQPKPRVEPVEPEPIEEPAEPEPVIEEVVVEEVVVDDLVRLGTVVENAGLHRLESLNMEGLQPVAALPAEVHSISIPIALPEAFISPPIRFSSPISLPPISNRGAVMSDINTGGK